MDGGDGAESGARRKDCGKSHCHNYTITFCTVYIINNTHMQIVCVLSVQMGTVCPLCLSGRLAPTDINGGCL